MYDNNADMDDEAQEMRLAGLGIKIPKPAEDPVLTIETLERIEKERHAYSEDHLRRRCSCYDSYWKSFSR